MAIGRPRLVGIEYVSFTGAFFSIYLILIQGTLGPSMSTTARMSTTAGTPITAGMPEMLSIAIVEGVIIYNDMYAKLLLTSPDVQVVSCAFVDPAVVDALTAVDVPGVALMLLQPILLMTSPVLLYFL